MGTESFTHDKSQFDAAVHPSGVDVDDAEAKYADLFAEVIWDGVITPQKRQRLNTAAKVFGLKRLRAKQIEQALTAAHEARHSVAVVEEESKGGDRSVAPLARAKDPRLLALQRRIDALEKIKRSSTEITRRSLPTM